MPGFLPDRLTVEVLSQGDARPCRIRMTLPDGSGATGELDLAALITRLAALKTSQNIDQVQAYGQVLFQALFPGNLASQFSAALAASRGRGIRLALLLDEALPGLHRIPWERLHHPQGSLWVPSAAAADIFLSRYLQTGHPWGLPLAAGPLKVLVVISSPFPAGSNLYVNTELEQQAIAAVFDRFPGQVEYDVLSGQVTAQQVADRLGQGQGFDLLHYIGHGDWHTDEQVGYLILSKKYDDGSIGPAGVSSGELVKLMAANPRLPYLIFLGACQSGQQSTHDAFAGVGPQLVLTGCPAVVCMQEKVESDAARQFALAFYSRLLESGVVDLAVNQARKGLLENRYLQWAVPVLYMHQLDGILFDPGQRFKPALRSPYKFLAPYQRDDQDLFKGRAAKVTEICQHLVQFPIAVVYGEAGNGLTSLVEAGVRPQLESVGGLVVSISDYRDLAGEFRLQVRVNNRPLYLSVSGDAPLPDVLRAVNLGSFTSLNLLLDQFEGVFSLADDEQQAVVQALEASLAALGSRLRLVILLHKEYLASLARFSSLLENRAGNWIELPPLDADGAVEAILAPLDVLGWPVALTPAFAREHIAPDLANLYEPATPAGQAWVDPGQLQITCTWLYQKALQRRPPLIDESLYLKEAGGADGILVRYMEEELQTRFADQAPMAKRILVALAAPDCSHWVLPEELAAALERPSVAGSNTAEGSPALSTPAAPVSAANIIPILNRLVKAELLTRRWMDSRYVYAFSNHTVAEEARRLGGEAVEQAYNAGDELERTWRLWLAGLAAHPGGGRLADQNLASSAQLRVLAPAAGHFDARPAKVLLLLRSAIQQEALPTPWISWLRQKEVESGLIQLLELPGEPPSARLAPSTASCELAGRLLGLGNPDLPRQPDSTAGFGAVAWSAAASPNPVDRQTAALALTVLPVGLPGVLARLEAALAALPDGLQRTMRRVEQLGVMADAGLGGDLIAQRPVLTRLSIYAWRTLRRILHNRRQITWLTLGGGIGAGLALGIERLVVGTLAQSGLGVMFFALFSYWGLILASLTSLGISTAGALLLEDVFTVQRKPRRTWLEILLGTLSFGLANLLVALLNGIHLAKVPWVIPLGFAVGLGLSTALAGAPKPKPLSWLLRAGIGGATFALVQALFLAFQSLGSGISMALSGGWFQTEYAHFAVYSWQRLIAVFPDWSNFLALVDSFFSGLALTLGALAGKQLAGGWLVRWKELFDRLGK